LRHFICWHQNASRATSHLRPCGASVREVIVQHTECFTSDNSGDISLQEMENRCSQYGRIGCLQEPQDIESVLVIEPPRVGLGDTLSDVVQLRNQQRCRSCDRDQEGARVSRLESADRSPRLVYKRGFETAYV